MLDTIGEASIDLRDQKETMKKTNKLEDEFQTSKMGGRFDIPAKYGHLFQIGRNWVKK